MDSADNQTTNENSLTFRDYVQVLFRQKAVIAVSMLTVVVTVFIGLKLQTKQYDASVKMLITAEKQVESPFYREAYSARNVEQTLTQSEIVKSDPVIMRVVTAQTLNRRPLDDEKRFSSTMKARLIDVQTNLFKHKLAAMSPEQQEALLYRRAKEMLKASIRVEPVRDTNMFTITVRDYNPIGAAILANTVSRAYVIYDLEQQLAELRLKYGDKHPKLVYLRSNIAKMEQTLDGQPLEDIDAIGPASVKIIEQASVPLEPSGTSKSLTFLLAVVMSVFLGVMLAFVFEYADQTIKTPRDVEQALSIPYLGSIRRRRLFEKLLVNYQKRLSAYGHSYQAACDHLYLLWKDKRIGSVMIASTLKTEDTPGVTANIGNYIAQVMKRKVMVIDADFRAPALHKVYKVTAEQGLADYLDGKAELKSIVHAVTDSLSFIPAGTTLLNPILLFDSPKMDELIREARKTHELVLVRSSAMRGHKEPAILSQHLDGLLVVVDEGKVRKQVIASAFSEVQGKARATLGVLLINRTFPIPKWIYEMI